MLRLAVAAVAATLVLGAASSAQAQNFAFFERVKISPIKSKGEVVGAKINLVGLCLVLQGLLCQFAY